MCVKILFTLAICILAVCATSTKRQAPNGWFEHMYDESDTSEKYAERLPSSMCCERITFQNDLYGEPIQHVDLPYSYWWDHGGVYLAVTNSLDVLPEPLVRISHQGLEIDGNQHSEKYLLIQCAYSCCLESISFVRASHAAQDIPVISAGLLGKPGRHESKLLPIKQNLAQEFYGWTPEMGIASEHMWIDNSHTKQDMRLEELRVCDYDGTGMFIHMILPVRAQYAIPELDLCFVDHNLELNWDTGLCHERQ